MSKTKRTKSKSAIQAVTVERDLDDRSSLQGRVAESRFPLDILVMWLRPDCRRRRRYLLAIESHLEWSFFLLPEKKEKTVEVISPNGYRSVFRSRFPASSRLTRAQKTEHLRSAATAFVRLMEYAKQQPEFSTISSLMAGCTVVRARD